MTEKVELPGGLCLDGRCRRDVRFRPVTGELELELGSLAISGGSWPDTVTAVLAAAVDQIGGHRADPELVSSLCVGDRHFLLKSLSTLLDGRPTWLTVHCGECDEAMDVSFTHAELPVKPAGEGYPERELDVGGLSCRVRCITGSDQSAVALADTDEEAMDVLLSRVVSAADGVPGSVAMDEDCRACIEAAIEEMSPEVADELLVDCPHCETANRVPITHFNADRGDTFELLADVHSLASNYHWSESEILALSRERRQLYLGLIDRARGMVSQRQVGEAG